MQDLQYSPSINRSAVFAWRLVARVPLFRPFDFSPVLVARHEQDPLQEISALSIMSEPGHPNVLQKVAALDDGEYVLPRCIPPLSGNVQDLKLIVRGAISRHGVVQNVWYGTNNERQVADHPQMVV